MTVWEWRFGWVLVWVGEAKLKAGGEGCRVEEVDHGSSHLGKKKKKWSPVSFALVNVLRFKCPGGNWALGVMWNFPLLMPPEMPLTWGINLEKPQFADRGTFYVLISEFSSESFTKSDVMISDTILCLCLANSKAPLWSWSVAVLAAGTSKFKLNCSERVGISLSLSWRMSLAQVAVDFCSDEKAKESWGRNYTLYSVSMGGGVLTPVPACVCGAWGPLDKLLSLSLFLATALDAASCVPLHHLAALLERDFQA